MSVVNAPFESRYGFKGPGFSVDNQGNIIATSIITSAVEDDDAAVFINFTVTDLANDFFIAEQGASPNPSITLARQSVYNFSLDVPDLKFNILVGNQQDSAFYSTGISFSDGTSDEDSQNKTSGTLRFSVPLNAPDTLYYADEVRNNFGVINIIDPIGKFSNIGVSDTTPATSSTTGALTIAGGLGVQGDLFIGGTLNIDGLGISEISSPTNLNLEAINELKLIIEGTNIAVASSSGLKSTIIDSTINNTSIGQIAPSTAAFTSATVGTLPTTDNSITNKNYVDSTALALSIAFGL